MNPRCLVLAALVLALAGCSSPPAPGGALQEARDRYSTAREDPEVTRLASGELERARESLRQAEQAWISGESRETVDHYAHLASRSVAIAQETASRLGTRTNDARAAAERDAMQPTVRTWKLDLSRKEVVDVATQLAALDAKETDRGMVMTVGDVVFDSGQWQVRSEGSRNLASLAEFLNRHPYGIAAIEGHSERTGNPDTDRRLSRQRADAVKSALVNMGVPEERLSVQAFGAAAPVADDDSISGRQMNRRVEIVIVPYALDEAWSYQSPVPEVRSRPES